MKEFIVEHKFCKCQKIIRGYDIYDALKRYNLNYKLWKQI